MSTEVNFDTPYFCKIEVSFDYIIFENNLGYADFDDYFYLGEKLSFSLTSTLRTTPFTRVLLNNYEIYENLRTSWNVCNTSNTKIFVRIRKYHIYPNKLCVKIKVLRLDRNTEFSKGVEQLKPDKM